MRDKTTLDNQLSLNMQAYNKHGLYLVSSTSQNITTLSHENLAYKHLFFEKLGFQLCEGVKEFKYKECN